MPNGCELVTGSGLEEPERAESTLRGRVTKLAGNHEEAVTGQLVNRYNIIVVVCRDTDVLLLLTHFLGSEQHLQVWMISGVSRERKCYPVHRSYHGKVRRAYSCFSCFHALTGCNSTSFLAGFGKKTCWSILKEMHT